MDIPIIDPKFHRAVIFDLDGVITKTAAVHFATWKEIFDTFLAKKGLSPFEESDYAQYVDGKPRYDGIASFLGSRGVTIPSGNPHDSPDEETVCGLANRKNELFLEKVQKDGVDVYPSTEALIRALKGRGVKVGVISSSKNCVTILEKVGLLSIFETKVDGLDAEQLGIKGKPAPDVFLEAAKNLGVDSQHAVVIEDAIAGVQAGKRGGFTLVIGVDRIGQRDALLNHGADVVVTDLEEVEIGKPSALDSLEEILALLQRKKPAFFLDFDGTLSPIVEHPNDARFAEGIPGLLEKLGHHCPIAIISGRDRLDIVHRAGVPHIFYAGSHGFDIAGPDSQHYENREADTFLKTLAELGDLVEKSLQGIPGVLIERKKYSLAIHYRMVAESDVEKVEEAVNATQTLYPSLRKTSGKKVYEFQPDIDWDKGKALLWLLDVMNLNRPDVIPFYIGDDTTDEDAFIALGNKGVGIAVQGCPKKTAADYTLKDPDEVKKFLELLSERYV